MLSRDNYLNESVKSCGCYRKELCKRKDNKFRKPLGEASRNCLYKSYKDNAFKRKLQFNIDLNTFDKLTSDNCYFCDIKPYQKIDKANKRNGDYIYNGIDRINNNLGYTKENSVSCCGICNRAKNNLSLEDFYLWIKRIIKHGKFNDNK